MTLFHHGAIAQIPCSSPSVYAFRVIGHIDDDAFEELAKFMNEAFDQHDKVNMLLDLTDYSGSDWDSVFDWDVISARFRALSNVEKYAVVGAPKGAVRMIEVMDKLIPVEAGTFESSEMDKAWNFVGASPSAAA